MSERGSYLMNRTEKNTNGIAAGLQQEQEQEWGPDQLAELVAVYMADKPALTFGLPGMLMSATKSVWRKRQLPSAVLFTNSWKWASIFAIK